MVKSYTKNLFRTFFKNQGRFWANFIIAFVSICITAGLGCMLGVYEKSYVKNFDETTPDLIIKLKDESYSLSGKADSINDEVFSDNSGYAREIVSFDVTIDDEISRFYFLNDEDDLLVGNPKIIQIENNTKSDDVSSIYSLKGTNSIKQKEIGENISLSLTDLYPEASFNLTLDFIVSGICESSLYTSEQQENAWVEEEDKYVDYIYFAFYSDLNENSKMFLNAIGITDIFIYFNEKDQYLKSSYDDEMDIKKEFFYSLFKEDSVSILSLKENTSYALFKNYSKKIRSIAIIIPFMFLLVCALVNSIIITRLIKDERGQIACFSSLGLSKSKITFKYTFFSLISIGLGVLVGYLVGCPLIPIVILPAYNSVFKMNGCSTSFYTLIGIIVSLAILIIGILITIFTSLNYLKDTPASLMKEKSPKPGKKIILEKIPFVWNIFNFSLKSSLRNIFRQKKNFWLTTCAIIGSEILVFIGFSLNDVSAALKDDPLFGNVASSMTSISALIIDLALVMAITVVYALTTMNIQDRNKELATLKVLGYYEGECSMYTFREILIETIIADIFGLPISTLVTWVALDYIDFGGIEDVRWYSYLLSFLVILVATCSVNLILLPKIRKIDMNESLKSID